VSLRPRQPRICRTPSDSSHRAYVVPSTRSTREAERVGHTRSCRSLRFEHGSAGVRPGQLMDVFIDSRRLWRCDSNHASRLGTGNADRVLKTDWPPPAISFNPREHASEHAANGKGARNVKATRMPCGRPASLRQRYGPRGAMCGPDYKRPRNEKSDVLIHIRHPANTASHRPEGRRTLRCAKDKPMVDPRLNARSSTTSLSAPSTPNPRPANRRGPAFWKPAPPATANRESELWPQFISQRRVDYSGESRNPTQDQTPSLGKAGGDGNLTRLGVAAAYRRLGRPPGRDGGSLLGSAAGAPPRHLPPDGPTKLTPASYECTRPRHSTCSRPAFDRQLGNRDVLAPAPAGRPAAEPTSRPTR